MRGSLLLSVAVALMASQAGPALAQEVAPEVRAVHERLLRQAEEHAARLRQAEPPR